MYFLNLGCSFINFTISSDEKRTLKGKYAKNWTQYQKILANEGYTTF